MKRKCVRVGKRAKPRSKPRSRFVVHDAWTFELRGPRDERLLYTKAMRRACRTYIDIILSLFGFHKFQVKDVTEG